VSRFRAYLGVGSNLDPENNVLGLLELLSRDPSVTLRGVSTFFRTPALGSTPQSIRTDPDYLNGVLEIDTSLDLAELGTLLGTLEIRLGRVRNADRFAPRTIDVDILLHLGEGSPPSAPHGDLFTRPFVALLLLELAPELLLPPDQTPLRDIAARFEGPGGTPETELTEALRRRFL